VRISLSHDIAQAWSYFDVTVMDPTGEPLAETGRGISYYFGGSGEDSWTEGSRWATLTFPPSTPGTYRLEAALEEAAPGAADATLRVFVQERRGRGLWAWIAAVHFAAAALWILSSRLRHSGRRWSGTDWTEESD
jgi:hypothetical protein